MITKDRDLPLNIYANGSGYIGVVRHNGVRYYLGWEKTVEGAQSLVDAFREEHPKRKPKRWQPGDKL
jgi:hypothetical protein